MDKRAIKEFAINARQKLITEVKIKANQLGIFTEKIDTPIEIEKSLHEFTSGLRIGQKAINQRQKLVAEITLRSKGSTHQEAFESVMEEVAYTWFNRLIAIRFMEVNHYLPEDIRVLSSEQANKTEPDIVTELLETDLAESFTSQEQQQIVDWKLEGSSESMDALYQFTFVKVCNDLNQYLPQLFEKIDDYTELLFAASYINQDGVIKDLQALSESNFDVSQGGQVEIIGWLYQYYNEERKNEVINIYKGAISKKDIPAATQLFTTDWVVRYMVDNSLGKYWLENSNDMSLKDKLEYLLPGELQVTGEVREPESLKVLDNAMGSGHILVYAFDVLLDIYQSQGYSPRDGASLIIKHNLYGLEIDKRAYQLAYFALMMKARQYDRLFLKSGISPNVYEFIETPELSQEVIQRFPIIQQTELFEVFKKAKEIGSIIKVSWEIEELVALREGLAISENDWTSMDILYNMPAVHRTLLTIIDIAEVMTSKYQAVVTNPPYLNKMSPELKKYVNTHYEDEKNDLFSVFIKLNTQLTASRGYAAYMTPFVWMFIKSFEKLRRYIINEQTIDSLIQMEYSAFEEATVPICTFVIKNTTENIGTYIKLSDFKGGMEVQRLKTKEAILLEETGYTYYVNQNALKKIPGSPIAYWASEEIINNFKETSLYDYSISPSQNITGNNAKYLRYHWELPKFKIGDKNGWIFYAKGGGFRKWYGNLIEVVNWTPEARKIYQYGDGIRASQIINEKYWYKKAITWGLITSSHPSFRVMPEGATFDKGGSSIIIEDESIYWYTLGLLNSKVFKSIVAILNPTLNFQVKDIRSLPIIIKDVTKIEKIVLNCVKLSESDWNSFERSWEFQKHSLLETNNVLLSECFSDYEEKSDTQFNNLRTFEKELNQLFINMYQVSSEISPEVLDKDISIRKADLPRDIKSFISYAVGVMFGRYSLDEEGLIYAGGEWDSSKYSTFIPDKDNLLIISEDEYFTDSSLDIVNRFVEFVEVVYSPETLEENLEFIAEALGGKGDSRKVIRNYFVKHFYKDHVQVYSKRPIYWQFDSGKQNGFKALMYLHRYDQDTLGKVRTDYLHELQKAYDGRLELRKQQIESSDSPKEKAVWQKEIEKLEKQRKEARDYDEKLGHLALKRISLDLDDGVIVNYDKLQRDSETNTKYQILSKGPAEPKK